ncbi:endonuclease domain-containing 1 protein [Danio rerio]|uniref:Endonuclease domain-containing 1 protein n=1 Tax=Danio rerio TaxID=7955 RepID=A0AB32TUK4_DANRE
MWFMHSSSHYIKSRVKLSADSSSSKHTSWFCGLRFIMKTLVFFLLPLFTFSEVLNDFTQCSQYFLDNTAPKFTAPKGVSVKPICQCLWDEDDQQRFLFATLYSTTWKIPIYSAYVFDGRETTGRCDAWYIEPQLDGEDEPCMRPKGYSHNIGTNQAVNSDYKNSDYDKGHVYPVMHTYNHLAMLATSTLTNTAPQNPDFNRKQWKQHEEAVIKDLESCAEAYVVAGVAPDTRVQVNNKITVSKFFWRATCCLNYNGVYIGKAYFGPNNNNKVEEVSVQYLENMLKSYYEIKIFPSIPRNILPPKFANPCN